jgi:hypothetical protein
MIVNKVKILKSELDRYLNLPVEITWDFSGRDQAIDEYEKTVLKEILGQSKDFEIIRFAHKPYQNENTSINYEFNFYDNLSPVSANTVTSNNWASTYVNEGFTIPEVYYQANSFKKSFFKLDFYDTTSENTQKNYFTIIIPTQQGGFQNVPLGPQIPNVDIKIPTFKLDYLEDKEGFFVYWLRNRDYIDIDTFYMSAKFFDGKLGVFVRMTNTPQPQITPSKFTFNGADYFYYEVKLNYQNFNYEVTKVFNQVRVGDNTSPIKWYEYVNP